MFCQNQNILLVTHQYTFIHQGQPFRVISALCRFGSGSFRPILVGRFGLIFFSFARLRIIGRTIIWLFDEESGDVKAFLSPSRLELIDRTVIWLFDEESLGIMSWFIGYILLMLSLFCLGYPMLFIKQ